MSPRNRFLRLTVLLFMVLFLFASASPSLAANPPSAGEVLINEYVANSSITEWVELYNTTGSDLDTING